MKNLSAPWAPLVVPLALTFAVASGLAGAARAQEEPPPTGIGGKVISSETGRPVIGAEVMVVGEDLGTFTDVNGVFDIDVDPGEYKLRISAPTFLDFMVTEVVAEPGKPAEVQVALKPVPEGGAVVSGQTPGGVEELVVTATAANADDAYQLAERQTADMVEETIGADFFNKTPATNVGDIVRRLAAINVENAFIFVRGLGTRYSTAVLNHSRLPSPDPMVRVIPLNLFPSNFVDSLSIIKTYSPNLQGDFAGGLVDINLKSYPDDFTYQIVVKLGGNTNTTFQDFKTYETARQAPNFFGIDTTRKLPGVFGDQRVVFANPEQPAQYAAALKNIWTPQTVTAPLNSTVQVQIGDRFDDIGYNFSVRWTNSYRTVPREIQRQFENAATPPAPPEPQVKEDFVYDRSIFATGLGAILTSGWDIDEHNRLNSRLMYQRITTDQTLQGSGFRQQDDTITLYTTRLEYQKEDLTFAQFEGEHELGKDIEFDWRTAFGRTTLDRPDVRTTVYQSTIQNPTPVYARNTGSGTRIWLNVKEKMVDNQGDFAFPFSIWNDQEATFHLGGAFMWRARSSQLRRFLFRPTRTNDTELLRMPAEAFLNAQKVAEGFTNFLEETVPQDSFSASQEVTAGYVMLELPIIEDLLRFSGGVRGENSVINIVYYRQDLQGQQQDRTLTNLNPMPAANLIWTPYEDMNVRAGYSQTVSRPEFRELSPILFPEPFGLRTVVGNPNLVQSTIDSFDLRWEWFLSELELASMSAFYKKIDQPIEQIVLSLAAVPATSFDNSDSAWLAGLEWELRKDFSFVSERLRDLMIYFNASWIKSQATRGQRQENETSNLQGTRPLQGQAPFVINTTLQYTDDDWGIFRILYNTKGNTLSSLGINGLPNIFQARRDELDFVWSQDVDIFDWPVNLRFTIQNMLNSRYLWTQNGITQAKFQTGLTFALQGTYQF